MMDTNKLFELYLAKDTFTRELVFARLYGRMEKSPKYETKKFFEELADLLEMIENNESEGGENNDE